MGKGRNQRLARRPAVREPKARFYIVTEGKNTEPQYFRMIEARYRHSLIKIEIEPAVGDPSAIARRCLEIAKDKGLASRRKRRDSFEANDEVWAIFDRDEHPHYEGAVAQCRDAKVQVARSNPCFELWLILHYQDFDRACDRGEVQAALEKLCSDYERNGAKSIDPRALVDLIETAETRAEAQINRRVEEDRPFGPPSTTVYELTRAIRNKPDKIN